MALCSGAPGVAEDWLRSLPAGRPRTPVQRCSCGPMRATSPEPARGNPRRISFSLSRGTWVGTSRHPGKGWERPTVKKEFPDSTAAPAPPLGTRLIPALREPGLWPAGSQATKFPASPGSLSTSLGFRALVRCGFFGWQLFCPVSQAPWQVCSGELTTE